MKVWKPDTSRRSRLHDRRGDLVTPRVLLGLPAALGDRFRPKQEPWMARGAIGQLDRLLTADTAVVELGSGSSTLWYGRRARRVISVEPDTQWYDMTRDRIAALDHMHVVNVPVVDFVTDWARRGEAIDVLVVDHTDLPDWSRVDSLRVLSPLCRVVVLDDSDRHEYGDADEQLRDWRRSRHQSFRGRPFQPTETTVWQRW